MSTETNFSAFGLSSALLKRLAGLGIHRPTPIQQESIPHLLDGRDLIGIAQTGTGKTLAFALPMVTNLQQGAQGLVLAPTRELADQTCQTFEQLGFRSALLIGGAPMGRQRAALRARPDVIVATPGRLMDHMTQGLKLSSVSFVVLDEGDRMLDMGFAPAIKRILGALPRNRQTALFSATMPSSIEGLAAEYLMDPIRIEIDRQGTPAEIVRQELMVVRQEEKFDLLGSLLDDSSGTVLVFSRTRHGARKLAKGLNSIGHKTAELHSDRTQAQRNAALDGFKRGQYRVLVATDIAARGIDVKEIGLVVNYDVPACAEDYVHRIGRTGRAGAEGFAVMLSTPDQHRDVRDIEKLIKKELILSERSPMARQHAPASRPTGNRNHSRPNSTQRRRFGRSFAGSR